jgi:transposase
LVSGKKYRRTGIVAAKMGGRILSPLQYEGTMDSQLFETWFENVLMDELDQQSAIVMDNAAFHRKSKLIELAEKHGHRLIFLPAYSPELNPIENFWAWLKAKLRRTLANFSCFDDALCYCFKSI